jgi:hypothetical protein
VSGIGAERRTNRKELCACAKIAICCENRQETLI